MDTVKGVLLLLCILLAGISFVLFIQYSAASAQIKDAVAANAFAIDLLRGMGVSCYAGPGDYSKTAECIKPLLFGYSFKESAFSQPNDKGEPGYLVLVNAKQGRIFNATLFKFYVNRELTQTGCTIPGTIDYNVACRFNFPGHCDKGTVLEVFYPQNATDVKVYTKNC